MQHEDSRLEASKSAQIVDSLQRQQQGASSIVDALSRISRKDVGRKQDLLKALPDPESCNDLSVLDPDPWLANDPLRAEVQNLRKDWEKALFDESIRLVHITMPQALDLLERAKRLSSPHLIVDSLNRIALIALIEDLTTISNFRGEWSADRLVAYHDLAWALYWS